MNAFWALFVCLFLICPAWCSGTLTVPSVPDCALQCLEDATSNIACADNAQCLCEDAGVINQVLACVEQSCLPRDTLTTLNVTSDACNASPRDKRQRFDVLTIALIVVISVIVGLRLFERLQCGSGLFVDDYIIIFCLFIDVANSAVCIHGLSPNGLGKDAWTMSADQITEFLRFLYVGQTLYATDVFSVKLCVLLFYLRIFPGATIRRLIWTTVILTIVCLVVFDILALAQCHPISYYWQGWDALHNGQCLGINALAWAIAAVSIIIDFWMLGLPLSQLMHLQMHWKRKMAVTMMFGVGTFVTVVSILRLRFLVAYGNSINPTWDGYSTCFWSVIELNVGICCACMPNLRLLLLRSFPKIVGSSSPHSSSGRYGSLGSRKTSGKQIESGGQGDGTLCAPTFTHPRGGKASSSTTELVEFVHPISNTEASM